MKENIDTSTATGKLMLKMISAIKILNVKICLRDNVKHKGRKEVSIPDFGKHYQRYMKREVSKTQLAKELGLSRPTLDKLIKEHIAVC
ncbi:hypothetical protein ACR0SZ_06345 [Bacillus velezensis]|uniref:hypothetical protein n=1 Tax=Bacillus velezensis TaxID=492670 RepID=UPI0024952723|nr:hypothetical protein [Bacillus velezensis]MED3659630.1 hypothetical protein [Bacillus velezensis]